MKDHQPEPLYACPLCGRSGFSARGLGAHYCEGKPLQPDGRKSRLNRTEIALIIQAGPLEPIEEE